MRAFNRISFALAAIAALMAWSCRAENYSDIWWNPSESGWGVTIADHETQLFAVWYTYDADGSPLWFTVPGGAFSSNRRFFTGDLYRATGSSFAGTFDPAAVTVMKVGSATFDFAPGAATAGTATFSWTIGSVTRTRQIQRQPFGDASADWGHDHTDIWWNAAESGWGLTVAQHGNDLFGAWFTYGPSGHPLFVVLPGVAATAADTYVGTLYTTTGPAYTGAIFDPTQVHVTAAGSATLQFTGDTGLFTATMAGVTQTKTITRQPFGNARPAALGKHLLLSRGVWAIFDRRGYPNGYYSGDMVRWLGELDSDLANFVGSGNVSPTVGAEIAAQLDKMQAMGINTVTLELRATDATFTNSFAPPTCNMGPSLGFLYPQPTLAELANLPVFFDLAKARGMRVLLLLNSTHMEEQPPTNAATWLGAIFSVIKDHPALDTIVFGGNKHVLTDSNGSTSCGTPAEAPLYLGAGSYAGQYVQWAIAYGLSQGVAPQKLSSEAVVGNYFLDQQAGAGSDAQDRHLWSPISVLKQIFDNLGIDPSQRTYVLSFYSQRKCFNPNHISLACTDADPHSWADQTAQNVRNVVGGSRVVVAEFGLLDKTAPGWSPSLSFESLTGVMAKYGIDGGAYWIWAETDAATQADPNLSGEPVRLRGLGDSYNRVQRELVDAYGFHLPSVPNGSFEEGATMPTGWTLAGAGSASRYRLADEPGQPAIVSRGDYALRIVSGTGANDQITVRSDPIAASPGVAYTTTANLRFRWSGDSLAGVSNPTRPHVFVGIQYFKVDGSASSIRPEDDFLLYQEDSPDGFGTFPNTYTPPADARSVRIVFGLARNGLAQPFTLDVDNVR
jgi:hypothetical protein